ncbi:alpha/beta hydrolase [Bacteroidota bacterium]
MIKNRLILVFIISFSFYSCSFNSTFFALKKQNEMLDISHLDNEEFYIKSYDESLIYCLLLNPEKEINATIFLFHGSGDNISSWTTFTVPLLENGFQVFMMEYRGFGKTKGKATHKNVLKDANIALQYLIDSIKIDNKLILLGQSYGGQLAINIAWKYPEYIDGLIIEGTFTTHNEIASSTVPKILKLFVKALVKSPYESKELIKDIKTPVLVIHSNEDKSVPIYMGQTLYNNANQPKYFWEITGKHVYGLLLFPHEYIEKFNDFF